MLERYIRYDAEKNSVFMKVEGSFSVALALPYEALERNHKALTSIVGETEWLKWGPVRAGRGGAYEAPARLRDRLQHHRRQPQL